MTKARRGKWKGRVVWTGKIRNAQQIWRGNVAYRVFAKMAMKLWILKKSDIFYSQRNVTFSEWILSIGFIYFFEYLLEINFLDRVASANCMCTRVGSLRDIQCTVQWPSGMQVEQELFDLHTGRPLKRVTIPDAVLIQLTSWWWARVCSKHVDDWNKRII